MLRIPGFLLLVLASARLLAADALRVSAVESWAMPVGVIREGVFQQGLVKDLAERVAREVGLPVRFVVLSRKRVDEAAQAGAIDLRCFANPAWVANPEAYVWSGPIWFRRDIVVAHRSVSMPTSLADLEGKVLGTVLGYSYPTLAADFQNGRFRQDEAPNEEALLRKVAANRTSYALSNSMSYDYFLKVSGLRNAFRDSPLVFGQTAVECAILKTSQIDPQRLLDILARLRKSGDIDRLLQRYR